MALKVLKQQAEAPVGAGGDRVFPKGLWKFTLLKPTKERTRPTPDFMHNADTTPKDKSPRVAGNDGEILSIWLGNAEPMRPEQGQPGQQIFFQDFIIRDGDTKIDDLDVDNPGTAGWQIQRDARLIANLAIALGATTEVSEGDKTYVELADNFVELLQNGTFDGQAVVAEVAHRAWESKAGKKGVEALITGFTTAS